MSELRIAFLINSFYPDTAGGAELFAFEVSKHLTREKGHEFHVITPRMSIRHQLQDWGYHLGKLPKYQNIKGIHIHRVPYIFHSKLSWFTYFLSAPYVFEKLGAFDVIHSHLVISAGFAGVLVKKISCLPLIITEQGLYHNELKYLRPAIKHSFHEADLIHVVSRILKKRVSDMDISPEKIHVVPNGVDVDKFRFDVEERERIRSELDLGEDPMIITVSRLVPKNGVDLLLRAFKIVRSEINNVKLIVLGDGPENQYLKDLSRHLRIKDSVLFLGHKPHEALPSYYSASDLFVRTPYDEGFGIVFIEAMACGLPTIGTDVGGVSDIIINGQNGVLIKKNNFIQIANEIINVLQDKKFMDRLSMQGRKTAIKKFSWNTISTEMDSLYHKIMA